MDFPFQLKAWHAVAPRLHVREDWQRWAEHPEILTTLPERAPDLAHVPALQRRRLSPAARLMFAAVHPPLVRRRWFLFRTTARCGAVLICGAICWWKVRFRRCHSGCRYIMRSPDSGLCIAAILQSTRHFVHAMQGWKRRLSRLARCSLKVRPRCWW